MAGSFKTPCPSCEADVLVKGANLIGRKIDCPKCKYRFTVPNPEGDDAGGDGFDVVETPKKKGNPKALIGIVLGVVGVAALGIGGYVMFGGEKEPLPVANSNPRPAMPKAPPKETPKDGTTKTTPITKKGTPPTGTPEGPVDPTKVGQGLADPTTPTAVKPVENLQIVDPSKLKDPANLLPGQSEAVLRVSMERLRQTPVYSAFFDKAMLDFFQTSMTFEASDIESVHLCLVDADRDPFVVIRTRKPISYVGLMQKVDMKPASMSPVNQRDLFELKLNANPFLTALSRVLSTETLKKDAGIPITEEDKKRWGEKPLGLHYYDSQTLIIGDLNIVARFLGELDKNGDPPFQTELLGNAPPATAPGAAPAPAPAAPPAAGPKPRSGKGGGRGESPAPPPAAPAAPGAPAEETKLFTDKSDYRTIRPELKQMLNRLEADPKNQPSLMYVDMISQRLFDYESLRDGNASTMDTIAAVMKFFFKEIKIIGLSVNQFNKNKLNATMLTQYLADSDLKTSVEKQILPLLGNMVAPFIEQTCGTNLIITTQIGTAPGVGGRTGGARNMEVQGMGDITNNSKIQVTHSDLVAATEFDIFPSGEYYNKIIQPALVNLATQVKGRMAVLSGETSWYSLSTRFARLTGDKKQFPVGTLPRESKPERFGLPYPPDQRCSFIVDLLPYLDQGGLRQTIQEKKYAWFDKQNIKAATTWVPQLLVGYYPQTAWRAFSPYADQGNLALGATNYVALSGLGRDSARFNPSDPKFAKLVGITGYNWGSKPAEITDGMSNTIYMIQVPPGHNRPWIAGGGATVMGVDNDKPIEDFVHTEPSGKRGTYALMADGSVRHIPDNIDPAVFKALVTRAGGETIADLDVKAPKQPMPKGMETELKGGNGGGVAGAFDKKPKEDRSKIDAAELQALQGKWKVNYMSIAGKPVPASTLDAFEMTMDINDIRLTSHRKDEADDSDVILQLDPKASPKRMVTRNETKKYTATVVYSLENDGKKLKIRIRIKPANADDFPKDVAIPKEGEADLYIELSRTSQD